MKKSLLLILTTFLVITSVLAQPQLMNYQGVARDQAGQVISNQQIALKISIITNNSNGPIVYSEIHRVTTTMLGVFNLHIGAGVPVSGSFTEIAWATDNHFAKVELDITGGSNFKEMGITQLLSVPYAFHAQTANSLINEEKYDLKSALPGIASQTWSLFGNRKTDPDKDKLGTTDETDLVFVTNNIERLRITAEGKLITADGVGLELGGNLKVNGDSTYIGKDLYVGRNVYLNVSDEFTPLGETVNFGDFTVERATNLNETLNVLGSVQFDSDLNVDGFTKLNSALHVYGESVLNNNLRVEDNAHFAKELNVDEYFSVNNNKFTVEGGTGNTRIAGDLDVFGDTGFAGDLEVTGKGKFANLTVKGIGETSGEHVAVFENVGDGDGDGIKIKLGKASANNGLGAFDMDKFMSADKLAKMKNIIDCDYGGNKGVLLGEIVVEGLAEDVATLLGLAAGVGNMVTGFINESIGLPYSFPGFQIVPEVTVFPGFGKSWSVAGIDFGFSIPSKKVGPYGISSFQLLPAIPRIDITPLGELLQGLELGYGYKIPDNYTLQNFDPRDLSFWGVPEFCFNEKVDDPLNNENSFITFSDSENETMGSVRAESVEDWKNNYIYNPMFLYKLYGAITSAVDKKHARYHFIGKIFEASVDYYKLGVEYSSGNGDYAEWLERINPDEIINAGDIVAVTGGKITKDLTNAEQIMAVSTHPIVLGNMPSDGGTYLGNNIAFMGQVPVKIMGTVSTGDYIVAKGNIPGYGVAVSSKDMTLEDFKLTVGRAWEDNADKGPKIVNTVVGVHNRDYLNIMKRYEQKFRESESRMEAIEAKIDMLSGMITEGREIN